MPKRVSLFQVLRRELGPVIVAEGLTEVREDASSRGCILNYLCESSPTGEFGFWFQRNVKSSHVGAVGSSFTLEFFRSWEERCSPDDRR